MLYVIKVIFSAKSLYSAEFNLLTEYFGDGDALKQTQHRNNHTAGAHR